MQANRGHYARGNDRRCERNNTPRSPVSGTPREVSTSESAHIVAVISARFAFVPMCPMRMTFPARAPKEPESRIPCPWRIAERIASAVVCGGTSNTETVFEYPLFK